VKIATFIREELSKMAGFWFVAPFSLVEVYRRFRCACCLHHQIEKSVNFYQTTRRNIPEEIHLQTRRRENLKSHNGKIVTSAAVKVRDLQCNIPEENLLHKKDGITLGIIYL
jgi:hypothetical protein